MSLSTEYPLWFVVFCLLISTTATWFLYHKSRLDIEGKYALWIKRGLILFRFLSVFIISFLLLGPLLKLILRKTEKPYIILALDNSQSLIAHKDSAFYRNELPEIISSLKNRLDDYEVKPYLFGKEIKPGTELTYTEKQTDIANVFQEVNNAYAGQNIGAVILASDGIYNEGSNPVYQVKELKAPVYTIALGDSNQHKDLLISHVTFNQITYVGNIFPLLVDVRAFRCGNANVNVTISQNGNTVATKSLSINSDHFFSSIPFEMEAKQEGTQHFQVQVSKLSGEVTYVNNRFDVFIHVINGKQKIQIVSNSPHPDIAALRQSLAGNENYDVIVHSHMDAKLNHEASLVILHQLPGLRGEGLNLIRQVMEKKTPVLFMVGAFTNLQLLNSIDPSLVISNSRNNLNEVLPLYNPSFASFTISTEEIEHIRKFPPLIAPYGAYKLSGEADILFHQQIGYVKTEYPLVFFSRKEGHRKGYFCGEGIWKWRLYDFNISKQQTINNVLSKTVQYLATREDKGRFRVTGKKRFAENEHIYFDAEVYNESYELVNTPEINIIIKNHRGAQFPYTFSRREKSYTLDAGILTPGNYSYEARTTLGNKTEIAKGQFSVSPLMIEFAQTVADHQLLNELSQQSRGKLFYPQQTDQLIDAVKSNENIKPIIYKQEEMKSWINLKGIFFLLILMLGVEWLVRKWNGTV